MRTDTPELFLIEPFFSHLQTFAVDSDSEDGFDSQNDTDDGVNGTGAYSNKNKPHESTKGKFYCFYLRHLSPSAD